MEQHGHEGAGALPGAWAVPALVALALAAYPAAVLLLRGRGTAWPSSRVFAWLGGGLAAGAAVAGPWAERAHHDFTAHMVGHVLLGMLGPLLLVLAAPVTLALRVLPLRTARFLARLLSSPPVRVLTHPFVAAVLNVGGLWLLYRTGLYAATRTEPLLHLLVHAHVLAAGYLFTFAVLRGPDPAPHGLTAPWRAAVLVAAIAAHNVLAKVVYAAPPEGVAAGQARAGAEVMYYAGAPVEIVLLFLVCRPWLLPRSDASGRATARRRDRPAHGAAPRSPRS